MKKYIIVPDFVPLYAMRKVFGPQSGPIRKPIAVDTDIILQLLNQKPPVKMYEVLLTNVKRLTYDKKVELTKENYNKDNFAEDSSDNQSNDQAKKGSGVELPKLENPINSDSMGIELHSVPSKSDEVEKEQDIANVEIKDTKSDDVEVADLINTVTAAKTVSADAAELTDKKTDKKAEAVDAETENENPQRLTKAQRRAMERAKCE